MRTKSSIPKSTTATTDDVLRVSPLLKKKKRIRPTKTVVLEEHVPIIVELGKKVKKSQLKNEDGTPLNTVQLHTLLPKGTAVCHENYQVFGTVVFVYPRYIGGQETPSVAVSWIENFAGIKVEENPDRISQESYPFGDRLTFYLK